MKRLEGGPAAREDRPATALLHDEPSARVVAFHLGAGQRVPPHSSDSTVLLHVVEGSGTFEGEGASELLTAGQTVVYAPGEMHAITAAAGPLRFLALITPRPGGA